MEIIINDKASVLVTLHSNITFHIILFHIIMLRFLHHFPGIPFMVTILESETYKYLRTVIAR